MSPNQAPSQVASVSACSQDRSGGPGWRAACSQVASSLRDSLRRAPVAPGHSEVAEDCSWGSHDHLAGSQVGPSRPSILPLGVGSARERLEECPARSTGCKGRWGLGGSWCPLNLPPRTRQALSGPPHSRKPSSGASVHLLPQHHAEVAAGLLQIRELSPRNTRKQMKSRRTAGPDPESTVSYWCTAVAHACPRCVPRLLGRGQPEAHAGGVQALVSPHLLS